MKLQGHQRLTKTSKWEFPKFTLLKLSLFYVQHSLNYQHDLCKDHSLIAPQIHYCWKDRYLHHRAYNTAIRPYTVYIESVLYVTFYKIIRYTNIITPWGNQGLFVLAVSVRGFRINSSERERGGYQMTAVILLREFPVNWLLMSFLQKQLDISHARHKELGIMPHRFTATIHSHYISDKCHSFVFTLANDGTIYQAFRHFCIRSMEHIKRNSLRI